MAGCVRLRAQARTTSRSPVGERVLLPAVRQADADTLIIADGFSCREQIEQTTGRRALHLAELLQLALANEARAPLHSSRSPVNARTGS